ncbi:hypothetical protein [Actinomadura sediminis]|uniref:Uncharacterized protein n=1 Tax=Actinomadura sediminis TaxID=1038904 RepID=A0ABW3EVY8_9ACTN
MGWLEKHGAALAATVALAVTAASVIWWPPLAGFVLGLALGGLGVHLRMTNRLAKAKREIDNLLRENGALRHRNTVLSSGVVAQATQVTYKFRPIVDEVDTADGPHGTLPLPEAGDEPAGPETSEPRTEPK